MFAAKTVVRWGVLLVVVFATNGTSAQPPEVSIDELVSKISVLPRYNQWSLIEPELRPALKQVVRISREQRERLVHSGSPAERGVGIFVAEQRGDVAALLSYVRLLTDEASTLPYAQPTAAVGQYARRDQTVGEYLTAAYLEWFGVDVDSSPARFRRVLGDVTDPERFVQPWLVRLWRARGNAGETAKLKEQINALPEDVRWAVITLGYKRSVYTLEEARGLLADLSREIRQAILNRAELLPGEPLFRVNDGAYRRVVLEECGRLLGTPPGERSDHPRGASPTRRP